MRERLERRTASDAGVFLGLGGVPLSLETILVSLTVIVVGGGDGDGGVGGVDVDVDALSWRVVG